MNKEDYLRACNAKDVYDLTVEQVKGYFFSCPCHASTLGNVIYALKHTLPVDYDNLIQTLREAIYNGKDFYCYYIEHKGLRFKLK